MREQDLRDLLSRYTPSGEGAPAASPTVPATPASGTPMPTPSATPSPVVTPTLSCPEIRDAWREALTTPLELPSGLGTNPRLVGVRGESVILGGQVNGRLVQRVFPHGLEGDSFALPPVSEGAMPLLAELTEERVVFGERIVSGSSRRWRFFVQEGPAVEPRLLVEERGVIGPEVMWVDGDHLRWADFVREEGDPPEHYRLTQIAVDDPDAVPQVVLEVEASGHPILLEDLILFKPEGTWVAYDRHTLEEATIPSFIPPDDYWRFQGGNEVIHDLDRVDGTEELVLTDVVTGESRPIWTGSLTDMVSVEGDTALVLWGRTVTLVDLNSGSQLEIMDDNGTGGGMQLTPELEGDLVVRRANGPRGDTGSMARLSDLPTAIPTC